MSESLQRGIARIDAELIGKDDLGIVQYRYYADETSAYYRVTEDEIEELGDMLVNPDPQISGDAYSHWCAGTETREEVRCQCGEWSGEACDWSGAEDDTVVVEFMPASLRAAHTEANNAGLWPHNGAQRIRVSQACADRMTEQDPDWVDGGAP